MFYQWYRYMFYSYSDLCYSSQLNLIKLDLSVSNFTWQQAFFVVQLGQRVFEGCWKTHVRTNSYTDGFKDSVVTCGRNLLWQVLDVAGKYVRTNTEWVKKGAIVWRGKWKTDTILWFILKVTCVKVCSNSSVFLWKFYRLSTFCTEVASTYLTTHLNQFVYGKSRCKMFQMTVIHLKHLIY